MMHPANKISTGSQGDHDNGREQKPMLMEFDSSNEEDM
jgi:hypothetical protein